MAYFEEFFDVMAEVLKPTSTIAHEKARHRPAASTACAGDSPDTMIKLDKRVS